MSTVESKIQNLMYELNKANNYIESLERAIDDARSNQTIKCECCNKDYVINTLTYIQTYWYEEPYSCSGGDSWHQGEGQFICPESLRQNRLLYNSKYSVPYEDRQKFAHNAKMQFEREYKSLFKNIEDLYDQDDVYKEADGRPINNYHIDNNHKKFGIDIQK